MRKLHLPFTSSPTMRFIIVGIMNTAVDFITLNALVLLGYTASLLFFGQEILIANIIAPVIAMIHSFVWNQAWVFPGSHQSLGRKVLSFFSITILSVFIIQQAVFNVLYYNIFNATSNILLLNFAKIIAGGLSLCINFLGYRHITFAKQSAPTTDPSQAQQSTTLSAKKDAYAQPRDTQTTADRSDTSNHQE